MSSPDPQPELPPVVDPRVVHAEARLAALREVTQLTLILTRATVNQAVEAMEAPSVVAPEPGDTAAARAATPRQDPAETVAKLSRNIRLCVTLEAKLEAALIAYLAGETVSCKDAEPKTKATDSSDADAEDPYGFIKAGRKGRARELVIDVVDREIPDREERDDIVEALDERLIFDMAYADVEALPIRELVERLCQDLKFKPDWRRWAGDGWKPDPPFHRPLHSPFKAPSRTPILGGGPDFDPRE